MAIDIIDKEVRDIIEFWVSTALMERNEGEIRLTQRLVNKKKIQGIRERRRLNEERLERSRQELKL